ncbi:DUF262 domain-containing protein [Devosia sp. A449]
MANKRSGPTDLQKITAEEAIRGASKTIRFDVTEFTVDYLVERMRTEVYYVPEYQRNMVWNDVRQSEFIESVIIGLPIPFLFYYEDGEGRFEIVDGSQRLRTLQKFMDNDLKLRGLELLEALNGFRYQDLETARRQKLGNRSIRGIVLEEGTDPETRTEMFRRINTGGRQANEAEIRRGSLPGPFNDLILELSKDLKFVEMTPLSQKAIQEREREELVTRFFVYKDGFGLDGEFQNYRDDPSRYIYAWIKRANEQAKSNPEILDASKKSFLEMLAFVESAFPNGFRKSVKGAQIPRVRFEAIAVGSSLALDIKPQMLINVPDAGSIVRSSRFEEVTRSDAANVRSRLVARIKCVRDELLNK